MGFDWCNYINSYYTINIVYCQVLLTGARAFFSIFTGVKAKKNIDTAPYLWYNKVRSFFLTIKLKGTRTEKLLRARI